MPIRRDLRRRRLLAAVDEHLAILRVVEARVRRRAAGLALRAVEVAESVRRRWPGARRPRS